MLSLLLSCSCDESEDGHVSVVGFAARLLQLCVYTASLADVVALGALMLHGIAWALLYFPQLWRNRSLRSGANHSLLCLSFLLMSEVCFLVASLLQRWTWAWQGFRMWRALMAAVLLAQVVYYKFFASKEFAVAVEVPYRRDTLDNEHDLLDEYETEGAAMGWHSRGQAAGAAHGIGGGGAGPNKAGAYGMAPSWGEALLGEQRGPPRVRIGVDPAFKAQGRAHSPARSRLPTSQQHILAQSAPRTVSPHLSPKLSPACSFVAVQPQPSSHSSVTSSSLLVSVGDGADHERRRVQALHQAHQAHGGRKNSAGVATGGSISPSTSFQPSPTSAFRPVAHSSASESSAPGTPTATTVPAGSSFSDVHVTHVSSTGYTLLTTASTNDGPSPPAPQQQKGAGAGATVAKLATLGLTIVGLTMVGVSSHSGAMDVSTHSSSGSLHAGAGSRVLLSTPTSTPSFTALSSSSSFSGPSPFGYDPEWCNDPYDSSGATAISLRIFSWLGCAFACLALFPQFIYNDSYMKSTGGLSFVSYGMQLLGNAAFILALTIPSHNDWLDNRYARAASITDGKEENVFFRNQVVLPLLIAHGVCFLQIWVLVVQRAKYRKQ